MHGAAGAELLILRQKRTQAGSFDLGGDLATLQDPFIGFDGRWIPLGQLRRRKAIIIPGTHFRLVLRVTTPLRQGECRSRVCGNLWPGEQPAPVLPLAPIPALELPDIRFFRNAQYL